MTRMVDRLTRERVVDAAVAIVETNGLTGLTMRTLCEKLGVSVTSIYWHVGNREALLDALVERMQASIVERKPEGDTPHQRVRSVARSLLDAIEAHGELIAIAHQRGAIAKVFAPARQAVAVEFSVAGLRGERLAEATNAVLLFVASYSLMESVTARTVGIETGTTELWEGGAAPIDGVAAARLSLQPDLHRAFEAGLDALIGGFLSS
jgi:TetR/AcrR family transcriptional regulator, tetracycline repressor protein